VRLLSTRPLSRSIIPSPHSADSLVVTDGQQAVGKIIYHDGSFFAFGADDILIGEYHSRQAAMRSIPRGAAS
jgi:hypothetical protein